MEQTPENPNKRLLSLGKIAFRVILVALVGWFIWQAIDKAIDDLREQQTDARTKLADLQAQLDSLTNDSQESRAKIDQLRDRQDELRSQQFSFSQLNFGWLAVAGALYLAGMLPSWLFWHNSLRAMGQRPTLWESFSAFYMSHLGKYVPGKAMVVVLRVGWIRSNRVDTTVAATSVFVETLTMMAVGALLASVLIFALFRDQTLLLIVAVTLLICAGVPTLPPIFRRTVLLLQVNRANPEIEKSLVGLNYRLMLGGWLTITLGWLLLGLSLWATLTAIPGVQMSLADFPLLVTCVSLAVVAGFLSMLPGGFLVREAVVLSLLVPYANISNVAALTSAILLRLSWLAAELAICGVLYIVRVTARGDPLSS